MPFRDTASDCAIAPAGMPPAVPTELYERLLMYSMRSPERETAPARALLLETISTASWKTALMPMKTTSMSALPTTTSMSEAPRWLDTAFRRYIIELFKNPRIRGAEKTMREAYYKYGERIAEAPQRSSWDF